MQEYWALVLSGVSDLIAIFPELYLYFLLLIVAGVGAVIYRAFTRKL